MRQGLCTAIKRSSPYKNNSTRRVWAHRGEPSKHNLWNGGESVWERWTDRKEKERARARERRKALLTLLLLCATYVGWPRQANRQHCWEKPQSIPQRNSGLLYEGEWERERETHTPQLTVWWTESWLRCLFIWTSSSSLRKQTCPGWSDSTQWEDWPVVQPLRPSLSPSISSHICSQAARLHNIHKQFSFLRFPVTDGPVPHNMDRGLLRACSEFWLTSSLCCLSCRATRYHWLRRVVWAEQTEGPSHPLLGIVPPHGRQMNSSQQ